MTPLGVFRYSQYCSKVFKINSGVVALEKLSPTTSMSGSFRRALNSVIVLPEPGGPPSISGLCLRQTRVQNLLVSNSIQGWDNDIRRCDRMRLDFNHRYSCLPSDPLAAGNLNVIINQRAA